MDIEYNLVTSTRYDPLNLVDGDRYWLLPYHVERLRQAAEEHKWMQAKDTLTIEEVRLECERAISEFIDADERTAFKIRILLAPNGILTATANATRPLPASSNPMSPSLFSFVPSSSDPMSMIDSSVVSSEFPADIQHTVSPAVVSLFLDTQPTPSSIFTRTKSTNRRHYDDARARVGLPPMTTASASASDANRPAMNTIQSSDGDVLLYTPDFLLTETSIRNVAFYRPSSSYPIQWLTPPLSTGCLSGVMRRYLLEQGRIAEAKDGELTKQDIREAEWVLVFNGVEGVRMGRVGTSRKLPQ